jgi:hypothetical protein
MFSRLPTNSLISILYPHCTNIIKGKPIDSTYNTTILNIFNTITTHNEKYQNEKQINKIYFTNSINNKSIINRGFHHTSVTNDIRSHTNLITHLDNTKLKIYEYIHIDLRTDLIPVLHYKLILNNKIIMNLTKTDYKKNYQITYDKKNVIDIFNIIKNEIKK